MIIVIDKLTNKVAGVNSPSTPFTIGIAVPEDFTLGKLISIQEGDIQKTNEAEQPLYLKEVFRSEPIYTIIGQEETTEDTGSPIMEQVQKTNNIGQKLYLELHLAPTIDAEGNIAEYVETIASEDHLGIANTPIMLAIQKTSISGELLYWKDIIETTFKEVLDHVEEVIEDRVPIAWEAKEISVQELMGYEKIEGTEEDDLSRPIYGEATKTIQVPTEYKDYTPIMVANMVPKYVILAESPEYFTSEEVVDAKYSAIAEASGRDFILADEFFTEDEIDYSKPKLANTGIKLMDILPQGEVTFKAVALDAPTKNLYLETLELCNGHTGILLRVNGVSPISGVYVLPEATSEVIISLHNPTNSIIGVGAYALTYNEEV